MSRDLVLCCDGTWNTPDLEAVTNVVKLYNTLERDLGQLCHYQSGVGTFGGPLSWLTGGATGAGLSRDVMNGYYWLATNYQPGDRIWLFGFSRGAYTARSVAGMVAKCGVATASEADVWPTVERLYENVYRGKQQLSEDTKLAYDPRNPGTVPFPIYFIGVWDTVGSLGVPDYFALLTLFDSPSNYEFHDVKLNPRVKHARHALALDEWRAPFTPTLWEVESPDSRAQTVKQVWFPGSHVDVGGGYVSAGLSNGALLWMINEASRAEPAKLRFREDVVRSIKENALDAVHDDNRAALAFLGSAFTAVEPTLDILFQGRPRAVPALVERDQYLEEQQTGQIHRSVFARQAARFIETGDYRPHATLKVGQSTTFSVQAHLEWNASGLYLEAGHEYQLTATGRWRDFDRWSGPEGDSERQLRRLPGTLLGKLEPIWQGLTHNPSANLMLTRRDEKAAWMSLIGVIANGHIQTEGNRQAHETFEIGSGRQYIVNKSGYFYAFANDSRGAYNDNLGTVELTIHRLR
jgi:hypothetical protein